MTTLTLPEVTLEQYGNGWHWSYAIDGDKYEYRTNEQGEGLWYRDSYGDWRQESGTCQFSLPSNRQNTYARIRRAVKRHVEQGAW